MLEQELGNGSRPKHNKNKPDFLFHVRQQHSSRGQENLIAHIYWLVNSTYCPPLSLSLSHTPPPAENPSRSDHTKYMNKYSLQFKHIGEDYKMAYLWSLDL